MLVSSEQPDDDAATAELPNDNHRFAIQTHPRKPAFGKVLVGIGFLFLGLGFAECFFHQPSGWLIPIPVRLDSFHVIIISFLFGIATVLFRWATKLSRPSAGLALKVDQRKPILFLRAFSDEEIVVKKGDMGLLYVSFPVSLEEIIVEELSGLGPVIAIGRPGEQTAPLGAFREYLSDETWKNAVDYWIDRASLILMVMGKVKVGEGLAWELSRIVQSDALNKLILVRPPCDEETFCRRWNEYQAVLQSCLPEFTGRELFVHFRIPDCPHVISINNEDFFPEDFGTSAKKSSRYYSLASEQLVGSIQRPALQQQTSPGAGESKVHVPKSDIEFDLSRLSWAGWMLIVPTIAIAAAASYFGTVYFKNAFPPDWSFVRAILSAVAALAPGMLFFIVAAKLLKSFGLKVFKPHKEVRKDKGMS